jgi:hypothetical protein
MRNEDMRQKGESNPPSVSDPVNGCPSEMRQKMDQLRKEVDNGGRIRIIQELLSDLNQTFRELYKLRMKG